MNQKRIAGLSPEAKGGNAVRKNVCHVKTQETQTTITKSNHQH